jgi:hypothetical protein
MAVFDSIRWPEMRPVALDLIQRMHEGNARGSFKIPLFDFSRVFAPNARESELVKVAKRGEIVFEASRDGVGRFRLPEGPQTLFDLGREGLVMRVPRRMSGTYELMPGGFRIIFKRGEELEGCKRIFVLVCNRVLSVKVTSKRVDVYLANRLLDLCVLFD